jgi:membrane protein
VVEVSPESPEARRKRKRFAKTRAHLERQVGPGTRPFEIVKRIAIGVYNDGFIYAGNLAYLALLTLFPFIIVATAVARLLGQTEGGMNTLVALLQTMPPEVADVVRKPIGDVLQARSGNLLWFGALVGLWTTGSFLETIRDVIRRAYGVTYTRPFWEYRLGSLGIILASVMLVLVAFALTITVASLQQFIVSFIPGIDTFFLTLFRIAPALVLFGSLYLLFYTLTPSRYRRTACPKWPGALFVTVWWLATSALLPVVITRLGGYDLTYGSLAGVAIVLLFFFVIGLGVVIGAELNAALAEAPDDSLKDDDEDEPE